MRALIRSLAPKRFEDVCALVALYRPGPMGTNMHNEYADRTNGRKPVAYYHPDLEEILAPTYGLMIYQEQLMRVAQKLAGYSLEEADNLRKAAAKKKRDLMRAERSKFVGGCERNGYGTEFGNEMFDIIEPFADYSFPKAHATGYGLIAYQTAWLKANYPVQYLAALLTSVKTNLDQAAVYLNECRLLDIPVLVPDVNASVSDFSCEFGDGFRIGAVRFGLSAVRNVGEGVSALIIEEREANGPFTDFHDFCERVDAAVLNKRTVESLIRGGAFDSLGHPRRGLLHRVRADRRRRAAPPARARAGHDEPVRHGRRVPATRRRARCSTTGSPIPDLEFDKTERLRLEKEMLGLYVSDHPLMGAERALRRLRRVLDRRARSTSTTARCARSPAS